MIEINNLHKAYGKHNVLNNLNLNINEGSIYGIVGTNGAGKTTLLEIMMGYLKSDSGEIKVANSLSSNSSNVSNVSFVPDSPALYEYLSGEEYLMFASAMFDVPKNERVRLTDKYLKLFNLNSARNELIKTYSNGMKQKISIAASIINDPKVLILDEPLTGIDMISAQIIKEYLKEFSEEKTVLLTTHLIELAHSLCDRIGIIHEGRIVEEFFTKNTSISSLESHIKHIYLQQGS